MAALTYMPVHASFPCVPCPLLAPALLRFRAARRWWSWTTVGSFRRGSWWTKMQELRLTCTLLPLLLLPEPLLPLRALPQHCYMRSRPCSAVPALLLPEPLLLLPETLPQFCSMRIRPCSAVPALHRPAWMCAWLVLTCCRARFGSGSGATGCSWSGCRGQPCRYLRAVARMQEGQGQAACR